MPPSGNAVIVKHSPRTPLCGAHFASAFEQNAVQTFFADYATTEKIVGDPRVDAVVAWDNLCVPAAEPPGLLQYVAANPTALITGDDATSPEGRRVKLYRLTAAGRKQLTQEVAAWRLFSGAIESVLGTT